MFNSWPRSKYIGKCEFCGASAYWNYEEDRVMFDNPGPGCLCCVENEDGDEEGKEARD